MTTWKSWIVPSSTGNFKKVSLIKTIKSYKVLYGEALGYLFQVFTIQRGRDSTS